MAPLLLEGETLGEKQRSYNQVVKQATETFQKIDQIDYNDPDIDNLLKIDIACHQRDVQYIINILKCNDMLYVSRAIKKSKWLIVDNSYSDIINPEYLHNELFPQMTSKAKCKLMLHIRLLLKDEKRVEEFFEFLKIHDLQSAFKWLPNCSKLFLENVIEAHAAHISKRLIKRLCEKSIIFLDIYCRKTQGYMKSQALQSTTFLLHDDFEKYMNIIDKNIKEDIYSLRLSPKVTKIIMDNDPQRILNNLEMYINCVDIKVLSKYIKQEELQEFIMLNKEKPEVKKLFEFENLQHFLKRLPTDEKFCFIKENFIENSTKIGRLSRYDPCTSSNIYQWYKYAPFEIAMIDLKKLIQGQSDLNERVAILNILLSCAGRNMQHIQSLVNFYHKNHINEPFKFKIQFVNNLIDKTKTHEYDENTWGQINDLFISMEVYEESKNNVQECVKAIILYNILHNESVPAIIENKFKFNTFASIQRRLNMDNKEKLFNYLYNYGLITLNKCNISNYNEFSEATLVLGNLLSLLRDWNKDLSNYPTVIDKIKQLIKIKTNRAWSLPLFINRTSNSVKRIFFQESMLWNPTEEACINALKYDPRLLDIYKQNVQNIYLYDDVILKQLLNKIRIYWHPSIGQNLKALYYEKLKLKINHKAAVSGLCLLMSLQESQEFIKKYAPATNKINWSQSDDNYFAIQKVLGKRLHLVRPQPPVAVALLYAKGDYLQYALPSINALLYNMSATRGREDIKKILNTPVSLQKHVIRLIFQKLTFNEIEIIFSQVWDSTKNKSIRCVIFKETFKILCTEKDPSIAQKIWELFSTFIDDLTSEENKNIYVTLSSVHLVPLPIKTLFWTKSYTFLKALPEKANCSHLFYNIKSRINGILEFLSVDHAIDIFFEFFQTDFKRYDVEEKAENLAIYLLSTRNKEIQFDRYEKVFLPILEKYLLSWNEQTNNIYCSRYKINQTVESLLRQIERVVLRKNMIMPIDLFSNILQHLEKNIRISKRENYILLTKLKLTLSYIQILDNIITTEKKTLSENQFNEKYSDNYNSLYVQAIPKFTQILLECLMEDISDMYPSIYLHFSDALESVLHQFCDKSKLKILQFLMQNEDFVEAHLLVLTLLPRYLYDDEDKALKFEILNKIFQHPSGEIRMHYWRYRDQ